MFGLKTDLYSGRPFYRYPTHFYAIENDDEVADDDDDGHDKVIYSTAAVGVIHNLSTNTQRTFCGHDDDITCISLAPESFGLVATGQLGRTPYICVWDCSCVPTSQDKHPRLSRFNHSYPVSDTGLVCTLGKGFFQRGVCAVCFTYDAKYICGIGCDDHHALGIWEVDLLTDSLLILFLDSNRNFDC